MTLRELVTAWQVQEKKCSDAFAAALSEINRELEAVGGYATTSHEQRPNGKSYCRDFWRQEDTFCGGVSVVGTDAGGKHAGKIAPYEPEVGDRCFALEQTWRKEAMALTEAIYAVREYIARANGRTGKLNHGEADTLARQGMGPEHIALALIKDEQEIEALTEPCPHCGEKLAKALPRGMELRCPSCGNITRASESGKGLIERMARRMKVRKLWNRPGADEFAVKLNSQPTYDEVEEARVWVEAVLEEQTR